MAVNEEVGHKSTWVSWRRAKGISGAGWDFSWAPITESEESNENWGMEKKSWRQKLGLQDKFEYSWIMMSTFWRWSTSCEEAALTYSGGGRDNWWAGAWGAGFVTISPKICTILKILNFGTHKTFDNAKSRYIMFWGDNFNVIWIFWLRNEVFLPSFEE